jgi:hypothetical protein
MKGWAVAVLPRRLPTDLIASHASADSEVKKSDEIPSEAFPDGSQEEAEASADAQRRERVPVGRERPLSRARRI